MPTFSMKRRVNDELHVFFLNKRKRNVTIKKNTKGYSLIYLTVVHPLYCSFYYNFM
jgi:hypothetical protein